MPEQRATVDVVTELGDMLIRHRGDAEVRLRLTRGGVARIFELPYTVAVSPDLFGELKGLLGPACLV
jgi:DNA polymerase-3 subunit alpha